MGDQRPSVLFVTRKYPPAIGGMETLAASAWRALARQPLRTTLVAHSGSQWWLPLFVPYAALRIVWARVRDRRLVVLCGDALLQTLLWPVLRLMRTRNATMVMGLDLTWPFGPYQWCVRRALPAAGRVIAISAATASVARTVGVPNAKVAVLRLAVPMPDVAAATRATARRAICARYGLPEDTLLLVSVSRLVPRKGLRWFVDSVLPRVHRATLLIAGSGPEQGAIAGAIRSQGLASRCRLVGAVDDATRELLLRGADVFVQPNVPVPHDIEGFGLVAIEAASRGAFVIASDLEGLRDAVIDGETGRLLTAADADAWVAMLESLAADPARRAREAEAQMAACRRSYDLDAMGSALRTLVLDVAP